MFSVSITNEVNSAMILESEVDLIKIYNNDQRKSGRAFVVLKDAMSCVLDGLLDNIRTRISALEEGSVVPMTGAHVSIKSGNYPNGTILFNGDNDTNSGMDVSDGKLTVTKDGYYTINTVVLYNAATQAGKYRITAGSNSFVLAIRSGDNIFDGKPRAFNLSAGDQISVALESTTGAIHTTRVNIVVQQVN